MVQNNKVPFLDYFLAMRPSQWTKNIVVLAAFFFALWDPSSSIHGQFAALYTVVPAMLIFCIVSSGIYIINDIRDLEADRNHPLKRFRPIAAGRVSPIGAWLFSLCLLTIGMTGAMMLSLPFAAVLAFYVVLQFFYSFGLKNVALLDIFMIATGFVLRAIAGAVVLNVVISPWLLLCTFLLALFLALCKRRHEKVIIKDLGDTSRPSLEKYDERLLDQLIAIISAATIVSYAMYTLSQDTVEKFGTSMLGFTIPMVAFGVFRYLDLVYRHEKGGRPEKILLTDVPILVNLFIYAVAIVTIFLLKG